LVERANGYLETSFLPGRRFTSPADFNLQLQEWLLRANARHHRGLGCRPMDRFEADRAAMLELPPVTPTLGRRTSVRLPRDHYVRLDANDYSVHPSVIGRRVEVIAGLDTVSVLCARRTVAVHERCWAKHQSITDPEHRAAADRLRRLPKPAPHPGADEVERRPLSDYDKAFGLHDDAVA
jgi:transposase